MGCGSPSVKTGIFPGEDEFKPTGDPKKDFFYCFDDEEIKLIEERKNERKNDDFEKYLKLYNKFKFDYLKELDDTIFLKQYTALLVKKSFTGEYRFKSDLFNFNYETLEIVSCKINKEKVQAKYEEKEDDYSKFTEIIINVTKSQKDEKFENLIILEFTFKIKQKRLFTLKYLYFHGYFDDPDTYTVIIYYDKKKINISARGEVDIEPISLSKNEIKIFNENYIYIFLKYNQKLKLSKEQETMLKNKFSSDELKQINSSLEKVELAEDCPILVYEKIKHTIIKEKEFSSEGKYVLINNDREINVRHSNNYIITELKLNDKLIPKVKELDENEEGYSIDESGDNNLHLFPKAPLIIIEIKTKSFFEEGYVHSPDISMDYKKLLEVEIADGGSFKFEIESNGMNLLFDKEDTKYKPIKKGNLYICSGIYEFLEGAKNKADFIEKMGEKDQNFNYNKWEKEFLKDTIPRKIILNKEEHDAYIEEYPSVEGDGLEAADGGEGEGEMGGEDYEGDY